jgi:hypothetical protein
MKQRPPLLIVFGSPKAIAVAFYVIPTDEQEKPVSLLNRRMDSDRLEAGRAGNQRPRFGHGLGKRMGLPGTNLQQRVFQDHLLIH